MRRITLFLMLLFFATLAEAQSCTSASCVASNASEAAVLAAMPSSSNTNATVLVSIPGGTSSWTSDFVYTIPSAVTTFTIQGATAVNFTGTAGTSSYAYTTADSTIIQDADSSNNSLIRINTGSTATKFRMTGITFQETSGATKYNGELSFTGDTHGFRFDHNHIGGPGGQDEWMRVEGHVIGVIDHNVGDQNPVNTNGENYFQAFDPVDDTIGLGDGSWRNGPEFGSLNALYIESNYIKGGSGNDCNWGARFVMRYNTLDNNYISIQTHGTKSPGGPQRGCLSYEAYNNYFTGSTSVPTSAVTGAKGGTALIYNNSLPAQTSYRFFQASTDRNGGDNAAETNNPNGWGYCGTATLTPSGGANGVGAGWDGNQPASSGYPCLDSLGRGQDTQSLNGTTWPGRLNSVTGTIAWPHQYLEPIYMWNNSLYSGATYVLTQGTNNVDYYYDQTAQGGSFNGTAGTGHGLHSARPSTCTAGPGGTYYTSPTGSYGVGYFATDDNGGAGEFYVCDSTNHWQGIYQPAGYPHPLVTGGGGGGGGGLTSTFTALSASNTTPPAGSTITLTANITPSSGPTGTVTFFDFGTSIGTGTVSSGSATHSVTGISAGTHAYTASYGGNSSYSFSSSSLLTVVTASTAGGTVVAPGGAFTAGVVIK
jgi:hypothetical protein